MKFLAFAALAVAEEITTEDFCKETDYCCTTTEECTTNFDKLKAEWDGYDVQPEGHAPVKGEMKCGAVTWSNDDDSYTGNFCLGKKECAGGTFEDDDDSTFTTVLGACGWADADCAAEGLTDD